MWMISNFHLTFWPQEIRASSTWSTVRWVSSVAWYVRSKSAVMRCQLDSRLSRRLGTTCSCSCRTWCSCLSCLSGLRSFGSWFGVEKRQLINKTCMISINGNWHSITTRRPCPPTTTTTSTPSSSSFRYHSKDKYRSTASSLSAKSSTRTYS